MDKPKIVYLDLPWGNFEVENKIFSNIDVEVVVYDPAKTPDISLLVRDATVIVNGAKSITEEIINAAPLCEGIVHAGIGVDSIDVSAATKRNIMVANVVGYCIDEVSDHALALLFCSARKVVQGFEVVKRGLWDWTNLTPIHRVRGSILGIIGFGKLGQALAVKAKAFGLRCIVFDPFIPKDISSKSGNEFVSLDELCAKSDYISIHCPLTDQTKNLIGERELRLMKPNTYIINTARGGIIDENALVKALKAGWISGAALDVTSPEPPDFNHQLFKLANVVVTPHVAFYSEESLKLLREETCEAVVRIITNHWPKSIVNPEIKGSPRHQNRR